jgi:RHS repeat-associated protein
LWYPKAILKRKSTEFFFLSEKKCTIFVTMIELTATYHQNSTVLPEALTAVNTGSQESPGKINGRFFQGLDYYPFGSLMPGRNLNASDYRFGFNGAEKDDEWTGNTGSHLSFKYRIYDSRIAKFLSVDPLWKKYPSLTTYQFSSLNPIWMREIEGLEGAVSNAIQDSMHMEHHDLASDSEFMKGQMQAEATGLLIYVAAFGGFYVAPYVIPYLAEGALITLTTAKNVEYAVGTWLVANQAAAGALWAMFEAAAGIEGAPELPTPESDLWKQFTAFAITILKETADQLTDGAKSKMQELEYKKELSDNTNVNLPSKEELKAVYKIDEKEMEKGKKEKKQDKSNETKKSDKEIKE